MHQIPSVSSSKGRLINGMSTCTLKKIVGMTELLGLVLVGNE